MVLLPGGLVAGLAGGGVGRGCRGGMLTVLLRLTGAVADLTGWLAVRDGCVGVRVVVLGGRGVGTGLCGIAALGGEVAAWGGCFLLSVAGLLAGGAGVAAAPGTPIRSARLLRHWSASWLLNFLLTPLTKIPARRSSA